MSDFGGLHADLPPGQFISPIPFHQRKFEDFEPPPNPPPAESVLWIADHAGSGSSALWEKLAVQHLETGLWPLLLRGYERPWRTGELDPDPASIIDAVDAETWLTSRWPDFSGDCPCARHYDGLPELAPPPESQGDPLYWAARLGSRLPGCLALVPAARGADAIAMAGWTGPCNRIDRPSETAAILRSFEDRFGAVVVSVGFATLELSIASPPTSLDHALWVAAEHHAFCPDNFDPQDDRGPLLFNEYAQALIGNHRWLFWWD
jgi:Domain of unknown function (DUF4253)